MEKVLCETIIDDIKTELAEAIEAGFDDYANKNNTIPANQQGATYTGDIAQQVYSQGLTKTSISLSLPGMIGFTQPLSGPAGYVFGMIQRKDTNINLQTPQHRLPTPTDEIITRKLVDTEIREVRLQVTQEAQQDIQSLFGKDFEKNFKDFQATGGEVWKGPNRNLAEFFLEVGMIRMSNKINTDFVQWLLDTATKKGTATIGNYADMDQVFGVLGELREALYKATNKSGKIFAVVSPRIAAFLSMKLAEASGAYTHIKTPVNNLMNGFVLTMGDIDIYQHNFTDTNPKIDPDVKGGMTPATHSETDGIVIVGYQGGDPDCASVYYTPYKEYIVQSENYDTGESDVWYKVRDAWTTNPLDTYNDTMINPNLGTPANIPAKNTSSFLMMCNVKMPAGLIQ